MIAVAEEPKPHISVSALATYTRCPRQYEHRYVLRTKPSHRPGGLAFGGAIHAGLATFYAYRRRGEDPPPGSVQTAFAEAWDEELRGDVPVLLEDEESPQELRERGLGMLGLFVESAPRPHRVLAVEEPFRVELHDEETGEVLPDLVGRFDAIVEDADGRRRVLEHKTAARRYSDDKLSFDPQPTAYALAAARMGIGPVGVTYQLLMKTKKPGLVFYDVERSTQDQHDFMATVAGIMRAVEAGAFYPVREWWCRGCPFAGPCLAG